MKQTLNWQIASIEDIKPETANVKSFTLALPAWMRHRAGQHYDLRGYTARAGRINGPQVEIRRSYDGQPSTGVLYGEGMATGWLLTPRKPRRTRPFARHRARVPRARRDPRRDRPRAGVGRGRGGDPREGHPRGPSPVAGDQPRGPLPADMNRPVVRHPDRP